MNVFNFWSSLLVQRCAQRAAHGERQYSPCTRTDLDISLLQKLGKRIVAEQCAFAWWGRSCVASDGRAVAVAVGVSVVQQKRQ